MIELTGWQLAGLVLAGLGVAVYAVAQLWAVQRRAEAAEALALQMEALYLGSQDKLRLQMEETLRLDRLYHQEMDRGDRLAALNETLRAQVRQLRQPSTERVRLLAPGWFSRN